MLIFWKMDLQQTNNIFCKVVGTKGHWQEVERMAGDKRDLDMVGGKIQVIDVTIPPQFITGDAVRSDVGGNTVASDKRRPVRDLENTPKTDSIDIGCT